MIRLSFENFVSNIRRNFSLQFCFYFHIFVFKLFTFLLQFCYYLHVLFCHSQIFCKYKFSESTICDATVQKKFNYFFSIIVQIYTVYM